MTERLAAIAASALLGVPLPLDEVVQGQGHALVWDWILPIGLCVLWITTYLLAAWALYVVSVLRFDTTDTLDSEGVPQQAAGRASVIGSPTPSGEQRASGPVDKLTQP